MIKQVMYKRVVSAEAMSKRPMQAGLHVDDTSWLRKDVICLHSINAKDGIVTSHLMLQIPKEDLDEVIEALKLFK